MPIIRVEMFAGRSEDQKQALVKELTEACTKTIRCKAEQVTILVTEVHKADWAEGGQLLGSRDSEHRSRR